MLAICYESFEKSYIGPIYAFCAHRIQDILGSAVTDPSMAGALPPGAWWEYATAGTAPPRPEAYGINAGQQTKAEFELAYDKASAIKCQGIQNKNHSPQMPCSYCMNM